MVMLYTSPNEMQYGMKYNTVLNNALTGISVGSSDFIIEFLIKDISLEKARTRVSGQQYFYDIRNNTGALGWIVYLAIAPSSLSLFQVGVGHIFGMIDIAPFKGTFHCYVIVRELSATMLINGHAIRTSVKAAHNINTTRIYLFNNQILGGVASPGIGCMARLYIGNFSGLSTDYLLSIHRKYLRTPFITPLELAPYEAFRFTGRQPDGSQILASSTVVYNEAPLSPGFGETLTIQWGGANWGQTREPIWTPR